MPVRGVDIVQLGLDGARWGVPWPGRERRRQRRRVVDAIATVGADGYASRPVGRLSGGEQQRLLIAQALVREPDLLLLDEPLEGLDLSSQQAVVGLIARICNSGVTVVMVAHDVNPVFAYLDRVVYIARGRAVAGRPAEVITTANLTRLYGAQVEVLHTSDGRLVVVGGPEATSFHARH
jgi:zinc/manganese transport system ATP-binding protein